MLQRSSYPLRIFPLAVVFSAFLSASLFSVPKESAVLWRYEENRYGQGTLQDAVSVPVGEDPYGFLAALSGFDDWTLRRDGRTVYIAERPHRGVIPILALHKLGHEEHYSLTPNRLRRLLRYLNENNWYLVSDRQYLEGDFTRVPTGAKPVVLGADDASRGSFIYRVQGNPLYGKVRRRFGSPLLDRDSMVAILERYAPREEGRINFTFYVSFDAVPFRQLDGADNPGFPYAGIPVVREKIRYLDSWFHLGLHSLSHVYAGRLDPEAFVLDVKRCWAALDDYAGGKALTVRTLAFPFGLENRDGTYPKALSEFRHRGLALAGAFNFDDRLASAIPENRMAVSRIRLDNGSWNRVMNLLETAPAVRARRLVIWETDKKRLPVIPTDTEKMDVLWVLALY